MKFYLYILLLALSACVTMPDDSEILIAERPFDIYPDYRDVTIPCNIAPLNFMVMDEGVDAVCYGGRAVSGNKMIFCESEWRTMVNHSLGNAMEIAFAVRRNGRWESDKLKIQVSKDSIDSYVTYRLIEPGYEVWNEVFIEERCVEDFSTRILAANENFDRSCMNCHIHGEKGKTSLFHIRGENGGTMLYRNGQLRKVKLRNDKMAGGAVYGDIDQTGRFGVFSTNVIIPALHAVGNRRLEVYDTKSDLCIADFDEEKMIISPLVADTTVFETFPAFSADGQKVFYCSAPFNGHVLDSIHSLHYSILSIDFKDGKWGSVTDTLWSAARYGGSANFPKASPDGRFLAFSRSDYGTFPIWHTETDLWLIDLEDGRCWPLEKANSNKSDTYHTWSSNSRWLVFASKRGDGQYGRVYMAHIDEDGKADKAFVLPQADPEHDWLNLKSYNIPDVSSIKARYNESYLQRVYREDKTIGFK